MTSIEQPISLTTHIPASQQWEVRPNNSYTTVKVTSFDELKARLQKGELRPAIQTSKGLLVKKVHQNTAYTHQWCFIILILFFI